MKPVAFFLAVVSGLALVAGPALAAPVGVSIAVDANANGTRVLLTFAEPIDYEVAATDGKIEIEFSKPVEIRPALRFEGDETLRRIRVRGDRILTLNTGPAYARHEIFELRNPYRLILDLTGAHGERTETRSERSRKPVVPKEVVVIDPGHGGIENGAIGPTGFKEKDVTLDLARHLRVRLQQLDPTLNIVLTRDEDRLVGLDERTAIANHNRAELFLSIHVNASPRSKASGAETYFLSAEATDDEARTLAALENRASGVEEESIASAGEAKRSLDLVLWDLAQNQYLEESGTLAEAVQAQLNQATGTRDRGVRQAPFRVLMGATMPAILVEVGFISNREEEARLQTTDYRNKIVDALATAVRDFLQRARQLDTRPSIP